jgi:integrase
MEAQTVLKCPNCGSAEINLNGKRYFENLELQRYKCKKCHSRFSDNLNTVRANIGINQIGVNPAQDVPINLVTTQTLEVVCAGDSNLIDYAWKQKKKGNAENTIKLRLTMLRQMQAKGCNLNDPHSVDVVLAVEPLTGSKKRHWVKSYASYTKLMKILWEAPKVNYQPKEPFKPTLEELTALINASNKRLATFLQVALTTGARAGEIAKLQWTDINSENCEISINEAEKGSNNRTIKVPQKTILWINALPKIYEPYIFNPNVDSTRTNFCYVKNKLAKTQSNPRFKQIHFHTFRHFFASQKLRKTKMLSHVQYLLGHKSIINTQRYVSMVEFTGEEKYFSAVATTRAEKQALIEDGFEYVSCDPDGTQYFRKMKD